MQEVKEARLLGVLSAVINGKSKIQISLSYVVQIARGILKFKMGKKGLIILFSIFFLLVPLVYADKLTYSSNDLGVKDMKVTLSDTILFGLIKTGDLGTIELKSHKTPTEVLQVGLGKQVVMYYDFNFLEEYLGGLGEVTFIDKKTGKQIYKPYTYVYLETKSYEQPIYKETCVGCKPEIVGYETIYFKQWSPYNSKDIPKEKIRIGVEVNVGMDEKIDTIWEIGNKAIDKHAVFSSGAVVSYVFENGLNYTILTFLTSGTFNITEDLSNVRILVIGGGGGGGSNSESVGGGGGAGGLIYNNSINLTTGNYNITVGSGGAGISNSNGNKGFYSLFIGNGIVMNGTSGGAGGKGNGVPGGSGGGGGTNFGGTFNQNNVSGFGYGMWGGLGSSSGYSGGGGGATSPGANFTGSTSSSAGLGVGGTGVTININGTSVCWAGGGGGGSYYNYLPIIGGCGGGTGGRSNVTTEGVNGLGGGGGGVGGPGATNGSRGGDGVVIIRYSIGTLDNVPFVGLFSPANATIFTSPSVNFIANVTDDLLIQNVSLLINGIVDQTNTSGIQGNYTFTKALSEGWYNWSIRVFDNVSKSNTSEIRYFNMTISPPVISNPKPEDNLLSNNNLIYFNATITDNFDLVNVSLYIDGSLNETNTSGIEGFYSFNKILGEGSHTWYLRAFDNNSFESTSSTRNILIDLSPPVINISSPVGTYDYLYVGKSLNLNFTVIDNLASISSCWYNYNGTNISIACTNGTLVSVPFILENDTSNLTVYSNDTFGNIGSGFISLSYKIFETSKEYDNETLEGNLEIFNLYLLRGSGVNIQSVVLHYVTQTHTSSLFSSESKTRAESELFINNVLADTNNTFYFTITLSDSTVFNTTSAVQLVRNVNLDDCSVQPYLLLNLSLVDEQDQTPISGEIEVYLSIINQNNFQEVLNFNGSYSNVSSKSFCSEILLNQTSFLLNAKIRYDSENHSAEFYNIQRSSLSSYPRTYTLYDLKDEDTTRFKLIYRGENLIGVVDAIIQLQREYISEGVYKIVEAPLTSSESTAIVHIDTNTQSYKATVVKDGVLLNTFENLVFICQSELTGECTLDLQDFIVPPNSVPIDTLQDFSYSISSDIDNQTITLDYSVPTGTNSQITVVAIQEDIIGEEVICNTTVSSAGGSIECEYNESIDDSYINYNVYKDGVLLIQKSYVVRDDLRDDFGGDNYFILIIFAISLIFMAILSPEWIVLNSIIAIIVGGATWLIRGMDFVLGLGAIAYLLLAGIIIIIKMSQKEDQ